MKPIARIAALVVCSLLASAAFAQSTAFTYQGKLNSNAQPAEGNHDFRFKLFDAATGGTQIGTTQCTDNLSVTGGVFTATIDFGQQFITTGQRFLEIEVRADTGLNCSNVGGFVVLTPRQPITPTPTATHAKTAFALAAADGLPAQAVFVDNAGRVGIGTITPGHSVTIAAPEPTLALWDADSGGGAGGQQVGYLSYRDSGNVERAWVGYGTVGDPDFSIINARPSGDIVLNTFGGGNVGIGTASPTAKLQVNGDIRMGSTGTQFAAGGDVPLRIIHGSVYTGNGKIWSGSGFSVTLLGPGRCRIVFDTPFSSFATAVASAENSSDQSPARFVEVVGQDVNFQTFQVVRRSDGGYFDGTINFIIVGPR